MPAYHDLPNVDQFRRDLAGSGLTLGQHRAPVVSIGVHRQDSDADCVMGVICQLLADHAQKRLSQLLADHGPRRYARHAVLDILGQLFSLTRMWQKKAPGDHRGRPAVAALIRVVEAKLCVIFGCSQPDLKESLKNHIGKGLADGMDHTDEEYVELLEDDNWKFHPHAEYLTRDTAWPLKLTFRNGVVHMWNWYEPAGELRLVRANSLKAENTKATTAGFAGFALGLGYSFYMGRHREKHDDHPRGAFTHGTYKSGRKVLCTGEIAIVDGKVRCVNNSSGHYKPEGPRMMHVARSLIANGINLSQVVFNVRTNDNSNYYNAQKYFVAGGNLARLTPISKREEKELLWSIPGWLPVTLRNNWCTEDELITAMFSDG